MSESSSFGRREFIRGGIAAAGAVMAADLIKSVAVPSQAAAAEATSGPFSPIKLPYSYGALEPVIDAETMEIHYSKHYQGYINKLNQIVSTDQKFSNIALADFVRNVSKYPEGIRNNAGGDWNHAFFWKIMASPGKNGAPSKELMDAITRDIGSLEDLKNGMAQAGLARFGSGWSWLILGQDGRLKITSSPNQDNPVMDIAQERGTPIIGIDVWEHAYYLKYRSARAEYLGQWWNVANWEEISNNFKQARAA